MLPIDKDEDAPLTEAEEEQLAIYEEMDPANWPTDDDDEDSD